MDTHFRVILIRTILGQPLPEREWSDLTKGNQTIDTPSILIIMLPSQTTLVCAQHIDRQRGEGFLSPIRVLSEACSLAGTQPLARGHQSISMLLPYLLSLFSFFSSSPLFTPYRDRLQLFRVETPVPLSYLFFFSGLGHLQL